MTMATIRTLLLLFFCFEVSAHPHLRVLEEEEDATVTFEVSEDGILYAVGKPGYSVPSHGIKGGVDGK